MKQDSTDDLIRQHEGLVFYTLNMLNCAYSDDARGVAYEALWRALRSFDDDRGVSFSTYAVTCIKNALYDLFRKAKEVQAYEVSIEALYELGEYDRGFEDEEPQQDYTALHKAVDEALNRLSGKKHTIAKLWLESSMSVTALAAEVPCSQSYASQTIAEFKAILRRDLTDAGYCRDDAVNQKDIKQP